MTVLASYDLTIPVRRHFELDALVLTEALARLGLDVSMPESARLSTASVHYVPVQVRLPHGVLNTGLTLSAPDGWSEAAEEAEDEGDEGDEEDDFGDTSDKLSIEDEDEDEDEDEEESDEDEDEEESDEDEDEEESDEDEDEEEAVWLEGEIGHFTIYAKNAPVPADENEVPLAWFVACALATLGDGAVVDPQGEGEPRSPAELARFLQHQKTLFDPNRPAWNVYPYDLFVALEEGDSEGALRELRRGAPIGARDTHGNTPLQLAFANGLPELGRLFITWGAQLHAVNRYGRTMLDAALDNEDPELIADLIAMGVPYGDIAFRLASAGAPSKLACLLDAGHPAHAVRFDGWTLLSLAAQAGDAETVCILMDRGADPRVPARDGRTPLALARAGGHADVEEALTERGVLY